MKKKASVWIFPGVIFLLTALQSGCLNYDPDGPTSSSLPDNPFINTRDVTSITMTSAVSGGFFGWPGRWKITYHGVCWSEKSDLPTLDDSKTEDGSGTGSFMSILKGLKPGTKYYIRAYATNGPVGSDPSITYAQPKSFVTLPEVPVVSTDPVLKFTNTTASAGGNVSSEGLTPVTERGVFWGLSPDPETTGTKSKIGTGAGSFSTNLMSLSPLTKYYVKAYAINSIGTAFGEPYVFTTNQEYSLPYFTTTPVTRFTLNSAESGGNIGYDGGSTVILRGVCWSTKPDPTTEDNATTDLNGMGNYSSILTDLSANTIYYVRAYAVNSLGTAYGNQLVFTTRTGTVTDVEGNIYYTQTIGSQIWMAENLRTRKFNNNTDIPYVTGNKEWAALLTPGCCFYNNSESTYKSTFGAMYNYNSVKTGNLCPAGWHVPNDDEWLILINFLGGESIAGQKLKEAGTDHWIGTNTGTNESGFTALPGGFRVVLEGTFWPHNIIYNLSDGYSYNDREGLWWSFTVYNSTFAETILIGNREDRVRLLPQPSGSGLSVRCIKSH